MVNVNVSFENAYETFAADDVYDVETVAVALAQHFLKNNDVVKNSALNGFDFSEISFGLIFVNDGEIHSINKEYRQKDSPTDVITFALFADAEPKFIHDGNVELGEIIISLDTIEKQAKENGNDFKNELYYIISHGILHLFGYDHLTQEEYELMVKLQKESLKEIDVKIH